jgi:hypothetical protein
MRKGTPPAVSGDEVLKVFEVVSLLRTSRANPTAPEDHLHQRELGPSLCDRHDRRHRRWLDRLGGSGHVIPLDYAALWEDKVVATPAGGHHPLHRHAVPGVDRRGPDRLPA